MQRCARLYPLSSSLVTLVINTSWIHICIPHSIYSHILTKAMMHVGSKIDHKLQHCNRPLLCFAVHSHIPSLIPFASSIFHSSLCFWCTCLRRFTCTTQLSPPFSEASLSELCSACVVFAEGKLHLASPSVFIHCMCAHYCCTCTHTLSELCSACVVFAEATYTRPSFPTLTAA